ncbi:hypothetical protein POPTR_011G026450v4 [Populus trichocarpa]|uniref:Uncharacterized protein n=1 Tax=Populus trichocarpa TaxID=3694 RepID=A0ACC0S7I7_POPTR|nr:hypothetical protein POPTR_011G026450v4 [Populus trichocarpa]
MSELHISDSLSFWGGEHGMRACLHPVLMVGKA